MDDIPVDVARITDAGSRRWWTLAALCLGLVVVEVDASILNVAIPSIAADLDADPAELVWIVDSFVLSFASFMLVAGRLGDRFGHRKVLEAGLLLFSLTSFAAASADSFTEVVVCRATLGISAAAVLPTSRALVMAVFPVAEHSRALGYWTAAIGLSLPLGPLLGGWLLADFWWGSVFLVGGAASLLAGLLNAVAPGPRRPGGDRGGWDPIGIVLSTFGTATLIFGLIEGPRLGWLSGTIIACYGSAVGALAAFLVWEHRATHPLVDPGLLRVRSFTVGSMVTASSLFVFNGLLFVLTQYLQILEGYSPLQAGLRVIPLGAGFTLGSVSSRRAALLIGQRDTLIIGFSVVGSALLVILLGTWTSGYLVTGVGVLLVGWGTGFTMACAVHMTLSEVPGSRAGAAGAFSNSVRQLGAALGVAVLGAALGTSAKIGGTGSPPGSRPAIDIPADAVSEVVTAYPGTGAENGFRLAFTVAAVVSGVCITLVFTTLRNSRSIRRE
ncbi:MFS transporter [Parafrankia discariae]|uniref:MFS transporter n=1 Tax=Parafrankia discariae TaxID=365528 RepID=UPI0003615F88|nr:MFS transporter [Parafrankia discariae]